VATLYAKQTGRSLPASLVVAALLTAPGEELFWRGLFQERLGEGTGRPAAAVLTWAICVAVYLFSESLPIIAGAVVGGLVWTGLALWTHGVLASVLSHSVWTAFMVAAPPGGRAARAAGHGRRRPREPSPT
jgi:membrane protease YdiL (CAAX protease family)